MLRSAAIIGSEKETTGAERLAGYREALADLGIAVDERLIVFCTGGSIETDAVTRTIRVSTDEGVQVLPWGEGKDYFGMVADHLNGKSERPIPEEIEFLPTKTVNLLRERAEEAAK